MTKWRVEVVQKIENRKKKIENRTELEKPNRTDCGWFGLVSEFWKPNRIESKCCKKRVILYLVLETACRSISLYSYWSTSFSQWLQSKTLNIDPLSLDPLISFPASAALRTFSQHNQSSSSSFPASNDSSHSQSLTLVTRGPRHPLGVSSLNPQLPLQG